MPPADGMEKNILGVSDRLMPSRPNVQIFPSLFFTDTGGWDTVKVIVSSEYPIALYARM